LMLPFDSGKPATANFDFGRFCTGFLVILIIYPQVQGVVAV
jgi:hypothetical protein